MCLASLKRCWWWYAFILTGDDDHFQSTAQQADAVAARMGRWKRGMLGMIWRAAGGASSAVIYVSGGNVAIVTVYDHDVYELALKQCEQSACFDVVKHSNNSSIVESRRYTL